MENHLLGLEFGQGAHSEKSLPLWIPQSLGVTEVCNNVALVIACLMIDVCVVSVSESRGMLWHLVHDLIYIMINKMATFFPHIPCAYSWVTWNLILPFLSNHQMVNIRNSQCIGQPSNNNNNNAHLEQLLTIQNQLMQAMLQTLNNMQPNQQHAPPPPPPQQSCLAEFLRTRPTTFSQAKDPMDAEDWLKGVEKKLVIAQCTDREKVLFAAHQLYGTAANWWETYYNTHANVDTIT
jgi:hypothetical protein